jgi:RimJ/RimL family protein N-acetyltransferase
MRASDADLILVPVTRFDRERLADLFERMSPESRYRRFLQPKRRLSDEELDDLTDIDHRTHDALAAVDPADSAFVGVASYAAVDDAATVADVALAVADDWQGRGVATLLLEALLAHAAGNGVRGLIALTLSDNAPARALLRRFGFHKVGSSHGVTELRLVLGATAELAA